MKGPFDINGDLSRRRFVELALATGLAATATISLVGCGRSSEKEDTSTKTPAKSNEKIDVKWDEMENISVGLLGKDIKIACLLVAMKQGLFAEEGLNVEYQSLQNLNDAITAISTNKLDILPFGVIPSCTFVGQGSDVVVFGGTVAESSEAISTVANKNSFKKPADFKGKNLGCFRMETGHMVMKGVLREAGLNVDQNDPNKDVTFTYLESMASVVAAVQNGDLDLGFVNSGYGYIAEKGGAAVAFHVGDWKADFPCCRQTTNRTYFEEHKGALVKFETALLRAYEIFENDHETVINDLVEYSGQERAYVEAVMYGNSTYKPAMIIEMDPYTDTVCDFYETMKANGDIDQSTQYRMEDHVDSKIYRQALDEMISRGEKTEFYQKLVGIYESHNTSAA